MKTPTFEINPERRLGHRDRAGRLSEALQRGFTLIELLVVFAIIGLVVAVVPLAFAKMRDSAEYSSVLRTALGDLRQARQKAMLTGASTEFFVDLAQRRYGITGLTSHELPEPLKIRVTFAQALVQPGQSARILFLPDGGATGGSVEVIRPNGAGTRLRVDWLSGMVNLERLLE